MKAKKLGCADVGMDCPFSVTSETEEQVMEHVMMHAGKVHADKMASMSDEDKAALMDKCHEAMQDVEV